MHWKINPKPLWIIFRGPSVYNTPFLEYMDEHFLSARRTLGERVRQQRRLLGISQEELAFRADIDRTYISQIERGVGNPSLQVLLRLAGVLQIKFAELVEGM